MAKGEKKGVGGRGKSSEGQVQGTPRIRENTRPGSTVNFCYLVELLKVFHG